MKVVNNKKKLMKKTANLNTMVSKYTKVDGIYSHNKKEK